MWIELHDTARDHPKVLKLARDLGRSQVVTVGHVTCLWMWTLRMAPDGDLSSFDIEDIEIGALWDGEPGAFVAAATKRQLLDKVGDTYRLHDWEEYAEHLKSAERKRNQRKRKAEQLQREALMSRDVTGHAVNSRDVTQTDQTRPDRPDRPDHIAQSCAEAAPSAPPLLVLDLIPRDGSFPITQALTDEWGRSFPGIDVLAELKKACQWAKDNPTRRKTKAGARKFLGSWLGRAQDRSKGNGNGGMKTRAWDAFPEMTVEEAEEGLR